MSSVTMSKSEMNTIMLEMQKEFPFYYMNNFEPRVLSIVDEYIPDEVPFSHRFRHVFVAFGLSQNYAEAIITASQCSEVNTIRCIVSILGANYDNIELDDKKILPTLRKGFSLAARRGHMEVIKYFVSLSPFIYTHEGVVEASEHGHYEIVKYLTDIRSNVLSNNSLAFRLASKNGHLKIVHYLVEKGAKINACNDYAIRSASQNGHLNVVKYLASRGAKVNALHDVAIRNAAKNGHLEVVEYLLSMGANPKSIDHLDIFVLLQSRNIELARYMSRLHVNFRPNGIENVNDFLLDY